MAQIGAHDGRVRALEVALEREHIAGGTPVPNQYVLDSRAILGVERELEGPRYFAQVVGVARADDRCRDLWAP